MGNYVKVRQKRIPLVYNAATLAAERTSATFSVAHRNVVTLHATCTRNAYTVLAWQLELSDDGGTTWRRQLAAEVSITSGAATATRGTESDSLTTSSSVNFQAVYNNVVAGPSGLARFKFSATNGGTSDFLTAHVVVQ